MTKKRTILIVDDTRQNLKILEMVLQDMKDVEVLKADNVRDAMEIFRTKNVDIIASDLNMPVEDGIDLVRQIRLTSSNVPVWLFSASDPPKDTVDYIERMGSDKFIPLATAKKICAELMDKFLKTVILLQLQHTQ